MHIAVTTNYPQIQWHKQWDMLMVSMSQNLNRMQQGLLALLLPVLDSSWGLEQLCLLGYFSLSPSPPVSPCDLSSMAVSRKWIFYVWFHSSQSTHVPQESGENHAVLLNLASEHGSVTPTTFYWSQIFLGSRGGNMDTCLSQSVTVTV